MRLFEVNAVKEFLRNPDRGRLEGWLEENNFSGIDLSNDHDYITAAALYYAKTKYPDAKLIDVCSFAALTAYLSTGMYSGFGTDEYIKERQAENIIISAAGGQAPSPDGIIALIPAGAEENPNKDFTYKMMTFLERFYFDDEVKAVNELLDISEDIVKAKIVLSLAKTQAEYQEAVEVADEFLKHKTNMTSLKKAVRKALGRA